MTTPKSRKVADHPISINGRSLSRRRIAKLIGVTPIYVGRIFRGERVPSLPVARKLAQVFGATIEEICAVLEVSHDSQD